MFKIPKDEYLTKAKLLSMEEAERVLSRMGGKIPRRIEKRKITQEEALAIQLELEDEQLQDWRKVMHGLKKKLENKNESGKEAKTNVEKIVEAPKNPKPQTKEKPKTKATKKAKVAEK